MNLSTNPGYIPGTVPTRRELRDPDALNLMISDLRGALGEVGSQAPITALLREVSHDPEAWVYFPDEGCEDLLTYR